MLSTAKPMQVVPSQASVEEWLYLLSCLGRAPATVIAYRRCLTHYLAYCRASRVAPEGATLENVSLYVRSLVHEVRRSRARRRSDATLRRCP